MALKPNLRLQSARRAAGLTQVQLAERSGLSQRIISSLETGDREGSVETYTRLSKALEVSVSYLLGERVPEPAQAYGRSEVLRDPGVPPELRRLAANATLCEELEITVEEWLCLRHLRLPYVIGFEAYLAILHVLRSCRPAV